MPRSVADCLQATAAELEVGVEDLLLTAHLAVLRAVTSNPALATRLSTPAGSRDLDLVQASAPWRQLVADARAAVRGSQLTDSPARTESELDLRGLTGGDFGSEPVAAPIVLQTAFNRVDRSVIVRVRARADLLEADWVQRYAGYVLAALRRMVGAVDTAHHPQDLLDLAEVAEQLTAHRGPDRPLSAAMFPGLFTRSAARHRAAPAVVRNGESWSYAELDARSADIASMLLAGGLQPEDAVAVVSNRTLAWAAATLGVLRAGGAYLPVRPDFPAARIATQLDRSGARFALVDDAGETTLIAARPELANLSTWHLDDQARADRSVGDLARGHPTRSAELRPPTGEQLAYIYFTSGSTGKPKGAMCEHAGLVNHLRAKIDDLGLGEGDTVLQTASQCFDISLWQLLAPLLVGGQVLIVDTDHQLDVPRFVDLLASGDVEVAQLVPSYLDLLMSHLQQNRSPLGNLRRVCVTGEALKYSLVERWFALFPDIPLVNAYGATEVSDDTMHEILLRPPVRGAVSIGHSLANVGTYILDEQLRLVPSGAPGEIVFAGVCVGRGYINDPERTAAAFTTDPYRPGERLYRTGDFGRWLPEGTIEFLGRRDEQVKVRGYRIEIGEIENQLAQMPGVTGCAVAVTGETDATRSLVACYTGSPDLAPADLRDFLGAQLPDYMVPAYFHRLAALPLNENGKVDKRRLLSLAESSARSGQAFAPPTTDPERRLATAWAEVLGLQVGRIGRDDDFFALGGTSLSAVRVVVNLDRALTLRQLTSAPTIRQLAALLESDGLAEPAPAAPLLHRLGAGVEHPKAILACFPYAAGNAVNFRALAEQLALDGVQVFGVELPGHDIAAQDDELAGVPEVAAQVRDELGRPHVPVLIYGHCAGAAPALELARLLEEAGRPAARVVVGSPPSLAADRVEAERQRVLAATDHELTAELRADRAYVELDLLKDERSRIVGRAYRHDVCAAGEYLLADRATLATPVDLLVSSDRPADDLAEHWARVSHDVAVRRLDCSGDYFVRTSPADVAGHVHDTLGVFGWPVEARVS